jgi:hypothetical protein
MTKTAFVSSGRFRVNASRKALDIWLIYKCEKCETTWNLTIFSGISPHSLSPELLNGFLQNDSELSMHYAADTALIKQNGGEPGLPEIEVSGESVDTAETVRIELIAEQSSGYSAASIIRSKLGLSRSEFIRFCESGRLVCVSGQNLKKCKLAGTIILEIR